MESPLKRRRRLVNGVLVLLLAAGVGAAYLTLADDGAATTAVSRTGTVTRGTVTATVSASGSIEAARSRSLSFATSGTVAKIYVKQGEKVTAGDILARLDQTSALENLQAAKANLAVAAEGDTSTAQGYASHLSAKNNYNSALRQYEGTVLKAPISGTVTAVNGTAGGSSSGSGSSGSSGSSSGSSSTSSGGAGGSSSGSSSGSSGSSSSTSSSGSGFIELADLSKVQVTGDFTEADTTRLKVGQRATVSFDALSGVTASGKVVAIDTAATTSNNVVQYGVTVRLTKKPAKVRIGQTATITITTESAENVLYVPATAVTTAGGRSTVTVVQKDGTRAVKTVEIGVKGDQGTEIKSGLSEGDQIVVSTGTSGSGSGSSTSGSGSGSGGTGGMPGGGIPGGGGRP